jgi:hypothetical protein
MLLGTPQRIVRHGTIREWAFGVNNSGRNGGKWALMPSGL